MSKMFLELKKKIKSDLTPERTGSGYDRIDIVINKRHTVAQESDNTMALERDKVKRVRCKVWTDEKGNEHISTTIPNEENEKHDSSGEVIFRTIHGKLRKHVHTYTAHFSFDKTEKDIPDMIEDEVSDMADFLCEELA